MKKSIIVSALVIGTTFSFALDLGSIAKGVMENISDNKTATSNSTSTINSNLDNATISNGLKEALKNGVSFATTELGKSDGYLNNKSVKIPLPDNIKTIESVIRKAGGDKMADDLINSMNSAASKAAPKTAEIFVDAIDKMSLTDAQKILNGGDTAATEYFKKNTTSSLKEAIKPIIEETMKENEVAGYYDTLNNYYQSSAKGLVDTSSVTNLAKNFGVDSYLPGNSNESLDDYVTSKAIDGLFTIIAQKEAAIRKNPAEQTSSILKEVFGK
ncbi:DUF4197 domain-containing protein [Aliarcobacter butzleri]|uniref:DUF4197 domain-containing protein n=1 Tax=Aliarcobacter butzleri TaxID=28197 RepID=UPI0021B17898|nr:DUF4197 domain-containing protein [Aliarcobacter butzleri]MCT7552092.1 DUF4197 domain-containing protein [Aliarcobacter butzleri]MCT7583260.1 DUF4197 domain-containing protein [Aliarcobacter butzleri]MCT7592184.1 DUF4197 domain-containing protein [Aliarcobacter butzleri]MCT7630056.1 DUF4197 domain-containing protein [Aliarcobacter butzleri]